jgi:hypothetical protein
VRGERDEHRGLRDIADDADAFEAESVRNRRAGPLEDRARAELPPGQRPGQFVECFELDMRLARYRRGPDLA